MFALGVCVRGYMDVFPPLPGHQLFTRLQVFFLTVQCVMLVHLSRVGNMAVFSAVGAWLMKRETSKDWQVLFEQARQQNGGQGVKHIVILPNYQEDAAMLRDTIKNIGRSPMARESIRVVLAMEAGSRVRTHTKSLDTRACALGCALSRGRIH